MEFSNRDINSVRSPLANQSGQAIIEYVLILVVTVSLILGGLYQLNSAFKTWANNYFGNYLACLLESGELPNIQGGGGDGGICNEIFKPFNLAEGKRLSEAYKPPEGGSSGTGGGSREAARAGNAVGRGGGGGSGGGGGRFASSSFGKGGPRSAGRGGKKGAGPNYTGSMAASDYGGYGSGPRKINVGVKKRLENKFAFEDEKEERQKKRNIASTGRKPGEEGSKTGRARLKRSDVKKTKDESVDSGLTLPSFLKWILIAGIIIALVVFLGGQGLQINKSME